MAKFNVFSVAAFLACFAIANVAADYGLEDSVGNPCPGCPTDRSYLPVCGDNGQSYDNLSILKCHSKCLKSEIKVERYGRCDAHVKPRIARGCPPCATTLEYRPVCGTNGETYPNKSALRCYNNCYKTDVQVKHEGVC